MPTMKLSPTMLKFNAFIDNKILHLKMNGTSRLCGVQHLENWMLPDTGLPPELTPIFQKILITTNYDLYPHTSYVSQWNWYLVKITSYNY